MKIDGSLELMPSVKCCKFQSINHSIKTFL